MLKVLKWARENGCDWDANTCLYAAQNGHLEVLKWARENRYEWDKEKCIQAAAKNVELVNWIKDN